MGEEIRTAEGTFPSGGAEGRAGVRPPASPNVIRLPARGGLVPSARPRLELLSCSIELHRPSGSLNGFHAVIASDERVFARRLQERYGPEGLRRARIGRGPNWSDAIADMLVSDAVGHMLDCAAADPGGALARGFEVSVEIGFSE